MEPISKITNEKKEKALETFWMVSCSIRDISPWDFSIMTLLPDPKNKIMGSDWLDDYFPLKLSNFEGSIYYISLKFKQNIDLWENKSCILQRIWN